MITKKTNKYVNSIGFIGHRLLKWLAYSLDYNLVTNLWTKLKGLHWQTVIHQKLTCSAILDVVQSVSHEKIERSKINVLMTSKTSYRHGAYIYIHVFFITLSLLK